jgi:hypothetical protein
MAIDVPSQIKFQHILSHTFPGFFSAITLFMLLDLMSPLNLTSLVLAKGIDGLIAFAGFIILIGTILGIIIDGIHHCLIEETIFQNDRTIVRLINSRKYLLMQYWKIRNKNKNMIYPSPNDIHFCEDCINNGAFGECPHINEKTKPCPIQKYSLAGEYYLYKDMSEKFIVISDYIIDNIYSYSEFYSNTFLALIPFSIVAPFYTYLVLNISGGFIFSIPLYSILESILISICAYLCIKFSLMEYTYYISAMNGVLRGYVDPLLPEKNAGQLSGIGSITPTGYSITGQVEIKNMEFIKKG